MMFTRGEYCDGSSTYGVICAHSKQDAEVLLVTSGTIASAYKTDGTNEYSYINPKAKEMYKVLKNGIAGCKAKNGEPMQFSLGSSMRHNYTKAKVDYSIELFDGEVVGASISWGDGCSIFLEYTDDKNLIPNGIPYVTLTVNRITTDQVLDEVPVRSVEEIALEKDDVSWLKYKKYYVVNDDDTAEKIFSSLDNWTGPISYDTETTGLKINCFGKINSEYSRKLAEYNAANPDHQLRADRLVGIIFCVEENVSYYFPCFNRKFKNLYTSDTEARRKAISIIKDRYSKPHSNPMQDDMEDYFRKTHEDQWSPDVILMERVRGILEKRHIVAHNGSFEYKVGCLYGIDTNLKDDTMIMHQIMYKFRSTTSNRGEPSNLKYLAKVELGIDQWELSDFFPDFKEDKSGQVRAANKRGKKKGSKIDFSYMDYAGTRVYAPTDGDVTFLLFKKYKQDMMDNHKEQEYIYNVEVIVSCCIGYMEFFGHRLDERKIYGVRDKTKAELACIESEIRQAVGFSKPDEIDAYNHLKESIDAFSAVDNAGDEDARNNAINGMLESTESLYSVIAKNEENQLNLGSPAQVAELFYDVLGYPMQGDKRSVASKQIKPLLKAKNDDGTQAYPVANMYAEYKKKDTLLVKFYDNLPYFMYPGGYIFSSFGQISTATGRMSCSHPNAQQYPKAITGICIPRDGYVMMDADYSQIEYRVLTALAGNTELAHLFADPDSDYHTLMASKMYGVDYAAVTPKMRSDAKSFNFGIPYGMGFKSLAILLTGNSKPSSVDEAKEKYELYFKNQPRTRKFFDQVKEMALVNKYTRTHWCRYRYYSFTDANGNENNARKGAALRQAGNAVIQGCLCGDTLIQTKEFGIVKIKDVAGKRLHVWDGTSWALGDITYSGKKQKCIVTFSTGQEFICSPIHKFLVRSSKGNESFVRCNELRSSVNSTNPSRVVMNKRYEKSDYVYKNNKQYLDSVTSHNANNVHLSDIGDSFGIGVVLGRLASDGSIFNRDIGGSSIRQIVAEHEDDVADKLMAYMGKLGARVTHNEVRDGRTEKMTYIDLYSKSIVSEISRLDVKHCVDDNIFMDTELLRGFLRGMFDGDGGVSGKTITLVFGTQYEFEPMCRDIQKALAMLGIRARYRKYEYRHVISISTYDNSKFMELVGFIGESKCNAGRGLSTVRDNSMFSGCTVVKSVDITDEYIDMYDVCNTDNGYYVADGVITHNTAADIFKISVARNFMYIRENHLQGLLLIINMIHDEQLFEVNVQKLNMQRVLADVGKNMQFKVEGFPPLYIGAGIGPAWGKAKGKMAEIHPLLLEQFTEEAKDIPIFHEDKVVDTNEVLKYFAKRVLDFRRKKVRDYICDPNNYNKDLHPAIGNLLNLQFTYWHDKDKEGLNDKEFTQLCLDEFIKHEGIQGVDSSMFKAKEESMEDVEEDAEYTDGDEENDDDVEIGDNMFTVVDESDMVFGATIQDLIHQFKFFISPKYKVCGIDAIDMYYTKKDELVDYLCQHICDEDADGAMQIVFLQPGNILNRTGLYVNNISEDVVASKV